MWNIDMYIDPAWISEHWPVDPRVEIPMKFSSYPDINFALCIYGDDFEIRHVRINTDFDSREVTQQFCNEKRSVIQNSIEIFSGLISGRRVNFGKFTGGTSSIVSILEKNGAPLTITERETPTGKFDYETFKHGIGMQFPGFEPYAFYLKMASDPTLPLDYRWLNYYRIIETRFNPKGVRNGLKYSDDFITILNSLSLISYRELQEIRGSIHAFSRGGSPGIGQYNSKYSKKMKDSLQKIHTIALEAINTHPDNSDLKLFNREIPDTN